MTEEAPQPITRTAGNSGHPRRSNTLILTLSAFAIMAGSVYLGYVIDTQKTTVRLSVPVTPTAAPAGKFRNDYLHYEVSYPRNWTVNYRSPIPGDREFGDNDELILMANAVDHIRIAGLSFLPGEKLQNVIAARAVSAEGVGRTETGFADNTGEITKVTNDFGHTVYIMSVPGDSSHYILIEPSGSLEAETAEILTGFKFN